MPTGTVAAHRLTLTAPEWSVLCALTQTPQPPGFDTGEDDVDPALRQEATDALSDRGVLVDGERQPAPPVAANLAILTGGPIVVDIAVSVRRRGLRARYALQGPLGASVLTLPDEAVELSMFPAASIGWELIRAVPDPTELARASDPIRLALAGAGAPPSGRIPLEVLAEYGPACRVAGSDGAAATTDRWQLTDAQRRLAARLDSEVTGVLRAVVTGRARGSAAVAQVIWLAAVSGWLATRPVTAADGTREVVITPAERTGFAAAVAPYLAQLIGDDND
ncbi:hypothetical protein [Micromonospora sp. DT31]|uniref:hypothetical protein n=1 Tax=Micromonospora sp. DT31 TaxID=3393434 RepID=UPI003CEDA986